MKQKAFEDRSDFIEGVSLVAQFELDHLDSVFADVDRDVLMVIISPVEID